VKKREGVRGRGSQRGWQRAYIALLRTRARERGHTHRCSYVHQHVRKRRRALRIMIRHFGITTKRRSHAFLRAVEFYIWDTSPPSADTETLTDQL